MTNEARAAASATQVPPFTLFEFVASQLSHIFSANNVKSGTMLLTVRSAWPLDDNAKGGTPLAANQKRFAASHTWRCRVGGSLPL